MEHEGDHLLPGKEIKTCENEEGSSGELSKGKAEGVKLGAVVNLLAAECTEAGCFPIPLL